MTSLGTNKPSSAPLCPQADHTTHVPTVGFTVLMSAVIPHCNGLQWHFLLQNIALSAQILNVFHTLGFKSLSEYNSLFPVL